MRRHFELRHYVGPEFVHFGQSVVCVVICYRLPTAAQTSLSTVQWTGLAALSLNLQFQVVSTLM